MGAQAFDARRLTFANSSTPPQSKLIHRPPRPNRGYRQYRYLSPAKKASARTDSGPGIDRKSLFPIAGEKARCRAASINFICSSHKFLFIPPGTHYLFVRCGPTEEQTTRTDHNQKG
jgi:hypothetical protein